MTQIVYDGRYLLADRRCSRSTTTVQSVKLRHNEKDGVKRYWAFSGSYLDCSLGDDVVESGFDERTIERAQALIQLDNLHNYNGILVEVNSEGRKVFIINYTGDRCEVPSHQFIAVGAMYEDITYAYKTWGRCASAMGVDKNIIFDPSYREGLTDRSHRLTALVGFLRFVLSGTMFDQTNYEFDSYDFEKGGKYQCV